MMPVRNRVVSGIVLLATLIILTPLFFKEAYIELNLLTTPPEPPIPSPGYFALGFHDGNAALTNPLNPPLSRAMAWVLQVGDYQSSVTAKMLVQTLRQKGYQAYALQMRQPTGFVTRVFVGPAIRVEELKILQAQLRQDMLLKTTMMVFNPLLSLQEDVREK